MTKNKQNLKNENQCSVERFMTEKQEQEHEDITRINKYHTSEQNLGTKKCFIYISMDNDRWSPSNIFKVQVFGGEETSE